jgi:hypothetical protein
MSKTTFLLDFCCQVKHAYEHTPPAKVRFNSINLDSASNWLVFQFGIDHLRKTDEIGIRWSRNEVTVDFLPGGTASNTVCFKDNHGLRWVFLDCSRACLTPTKQEKDDIERIVTNVYVIAHHYKPNLRFLIGHSSQIKTVRANK